MSYFNVCEECGANLDPGEKCTCREEREQRDRKLQELYKEDGNMQYAINSIYLEE